MIEKWRGIKGFEGIYEVSNKGNIRNYKTKHILKRQNIQGSLMVGLYKYNAKLGKRRNTSVSVARMVATTFLPNAKKGYIGFKDGNKLNCNVNNLFWRTHTEVYGEIDNTSLKMDITSINLETGERKRYFKTKDILKDDFTIHSVYRCLAKIGKNETKGHAWYKTEELKKLEKH